jgi:uncharacterized membrane protein
MKITPATQGVCVLLNKKKVLLQVKKLSKSRILPYVILAIFITSYVAFFSILTVDRHHRFDTQAFDLGIADQAIWQYSRFLTPFNTVAGVHMLGNHFRLIYPLISPLYWFIDDVRALLVLQTIVLAAAAIPLYLLAKTFLKSTWLPLPICFSYLLFPALQYANLDEFHAESFVPLFIFSAFYFIHNKKNWQYWAMVFLTLTTKEEIALTVLLLGTYIYFKYDKKIGLRTSIIAFLWYVLATKLFIPFFGYNNYLHAGRSALDFGEIAGGIVSGILNFQNPLPILFNATNGTYLWELLSPVAFLALLSPLILIISASLWGTLLTSWSYAHSIKYHYSPPIIPFIFIAIIHGLARYRRKKIMMYALLTLLVSSSLISNYYIAPYDASIKNHAQIITKIRNFNTPTQEETQLRHMISIIPKNASVSASHGLVAQLTHRQKIYMFPNPFKSHYWTGSQYGHPPPEIYVDYLLLQNKHIEENKDILQPLLNNGTYAYIQTAKDFSLLQRQN